MANQKEYYKGKGGGFFQIQVVMNFMNMCMPVVRLYIENAPTMH
jgi:hypothetical protein